MLLKNGDYIKIIPNSFFMGNRKVPNELINTKLIVREIHGNFIGVSKKEVGPIYGIIDKKFIKKYKEEKISKFEENNQNILLNEEDISIEDILNS